MEESKNNIVKLVKKKKKQVIQEDIEKKTEELCELIKNFKGSKSDVAEFICFEVVNWASYNHYEALGILTETIARYREVARAASEEGEEK